MFPVQSHQSTYITFMKNNSEKPIIKIGDFQAITGSQKACAEPAPLLSELVEPKYRSRIMSWIIKRHQINN